MQNPPPVDDEVNEQVEKLLHECDRYAKEGAYLFALSKCRLALRILQGKL